MPNNLHLRKFVDSQDVKASETLLKSARQYICKIIWSLWKDISSKKFVLVVSEILRLFFNIIAHDEKYSLSVKASV